MRTFISNETELRDFIRAIRTYGVEEDDGMYHLEVTPERFESLCLDPKLLDVVKYMLPSSKESFKRKEAIRGWYGALITPSWIIKKERRIA